MKNRPSNLFFEGQWITGPLVPLAIKVLREQFDSGEAFGSDVLGPFTAVFNPAGEAAAVLGKEKKRRSENNWPRTKRNQLGTSKLKKVAKTTAEFPERNWDQRE